MRAFFAACWLAVRLMAVACWEAFRHPRSHSTIVVGTDRSIRVIRRSGSTAGPRGTR